MTGWESGITYNKGLVVMILYFIECKVSHQDFVNNKMWDCPILKFCGPHVASTLRLAQAVGERRLRTLLTAILVYEAYDLWSR